MITRLILTVVVFMGLLVNTYYAGKGEFRKSRRECVGDAIAGTILLVLVIGFWDS